MYFIFLKKRKPFEILNRKFFLEYNTPRNWHRVWYFHAITVIHCLFALICVTCFFHANLIVLTFFLWLFSVHTEGSVIIVDSLSYNRGKQDNKIRQAFYVSLSEISKSCMRRCHIKFVPPVSNNRVLIKCQCFWNNSFSNNLFF